MTDKKSSVNRQSMNIDVPIALRGDLRAFIIVGRPGRGFFIYHMLTKGNLFLQEKKEVLGSRNIKVNIGDIVCLWADQKTGFEEFCGYLDESGKTISNVETKHQIPDRYRIYVQSWCKSKRELISKIKKGKLKLSKDVLDVKGFRIPKEIIKRKFGIDIEDDTYISSDKKKENRRNI